MLLKLNYINKITIIKNIYNMHRKKLQKNFYTTKQYTNLSEQLAE